MNCTKFTSLEAQGPFFTISNNQLVWVATDSTQFLLPKSDSDLFGFHVNKQESFTHKI